jgi:hypothetical protein
MLAAHYNITPKSSKDVIVGTNKKTNNTPLRLDISRINVINIGAEDATISCYLKVFNQINGQTTVYYIIDNLVLPASTSLSLIDETVKSTDEFTLVITNKSSSSSVTCYVEHQTVRDSKFVEQYTKNKY